MSSEKGEKSPNSAAREWAEIARREFDEAFPDQPMSQAELRGLLHVSLLGELRLEPVFRQDEPDEAGGRRHRVMIECGHERCFTRLSEGAVPGLPLHAELIWPRLI